ncbi:MAG: DUF1402 family protein [Bdellovibrionales bacterium]|nr:DUF1402 family protein [Bdellovibrionales bacterium]
MFKSVSIFLCLLMSSSVWAGGLVPVPISTTERGATVPAKNSVSKAVGLVRNMKGKIKKAATAFGIDPIHIAAAIAGEQALNVGGEDTAQYYALRLETFVDGWIGRNSGRGKELFNLISSAEYRDCNSKRSDYSFWTCVSAKWERSTGRKMGTPFSKYFFDPNGRGLTFGVGQMSPVRALMLTDKVSRVGIRKLQFRYNGDLGPIYEHILDPDTVVYYIAASIKTSIDAYAQYAGLDISMNPAITSTLYNTGKEYAKASSKGRLIKQSGRVVYPQANKMGRWVLQNLDTIEAALR